MENMTKIQRLYTLLVIFTTLAFITNFISFVSPYWIQSLPSANSQFKRIGLWTACFNGYMRPGMYNKAYFGCYYIYYVEYDAIRCWINPSITLSAALVAFAVARYDSRWMPYPGLNILSWSYVVAAFSFAFSLCAFLVAFVYYIYLDAQLDAEQKPLMAQDDDDDPNQAGLRSTALTHDDLEASPDEPMGKQSYLGSSIVRPDEWDERESEFRTDSHPPSYMKHASSVTHDSRR